MNPPPRNQADIALVHSITALYKNVYIFGSKIPKRDKLGIQLKIESACLEMLRLSLDAALRGMEAKVPIVKELRIVIEVTKQLIRISHELNIVNQQKYIVLEGRLQEISKMTSGWINYLAQKGP